MKRISATILILTFVLSLVTASAPAAKSRISLLFDFGLTTMSGGEAAAYTFQPAYGLGVGYHFSEDWSLDLTMNRYSFSDDTTADFSFLPWHDGDAASQDFEAWRIGARIWKQNVWAEKRLGLALGIGGGLLAWEVKDPQTGRVMTVAKDATDSADFSANELFFSGGASLAYFVTPVIEAGSQLDIDYLTGMGVDFNDPHVNGRDDFLVSLAVTLRYYFGREKAVRDEPLEEMIWSSTEDDPVVRRETTEQLVPTAQEPTLEVTKGFVIGSDTADGDGDGVYDTDDYCAGTDLAARATIDIHGCPIDSDYDGIPDYLDDCPNNRIGSAVGPNGCPQDGDGDGVPDGIDDCPNTLPTAEVDQYGCIDLTMLSETMVLYIDYVPGSFEIDPRNRERLRQLSRLLNFVPQIKLEISGYTDNIGTEAANRQLSEKRANRVRDYLVLLGVNRERIRVFGRGETNFVASNDTREGRARNRRIEINFFK